MKGNELKVYHVNDGSIFGYDITEDNQRVWYFIQEDVFGDGEHYTIWNPDNRLRSYKSFKEALIYQAKAMEIPLFPESKYYIVRSYSPTDFRNIERTRWIDESDYYA